jgi:hypothetical protein
VTFLRRRQIHITCTDPDHDHQSKDKKHTVIEFQKCARVTKRFSYFVVMIEWCRNMNPDYCLSGQSPYKLTWLVPSKVRIHYSEGVSRFLFEVEPGEKTQQTHRFLIVQCDYFFDCGNREFQMRKTQLHGPHLELGKRRKVTVFYEFYVNRRVRIFITKNLYRNNTRKLCT